MSDYIIGGQDQNRPNIVAEPIPEPRKIQLPAEMLAEVKKLIPTLEEIEKLLQPLVQHEAGRILLLTSPSMIKFLLDQEEVAAKRLAPRLIQIDRDYMVYSLRSVMENRKVQVGLKKEHLDFQSYEIAIQDLKSIGGQLPVHMPPKGTGPSFTIDLENPLPEIPPS